MSSEFHHESLDNDDAPPATEVIWLAGYIDKPKTAAVRAQTWHEARHKAVIALNADPANLDVVRASHSIDYPELQLHGH